MKSLAASDNSTTAPPDAKQRVSLEIGNTGLRNEDLPLREFVSKRSSDSTT